MELDPYRFFKILKIFAKQEYFEHNIKHKCFENQTELGQFILPSNIAGLFGASWNMVHYLMCQLSMVVILKPVRCNQDQSLLCLSDTQFDQDHILNDQLNSVSSLMAGEGYLTEILGALKFSNDQSYFSYFKLFSYMIWILFSLQILACSFIFHKLERAKKTFINWVTILLKFSVNQNCTLFRLITKNKKSIILVLSIWILCSTLLTKCFTSLLLRTYFKTKTSITVRTLEEVANRPELSIAGRHGLLEITQRKPEVYNNLVKRLETYENKLGIDSTDLRQLGTKKLIEDVYEGRAVIIADTFHTNLFSRIHPNLNLIQSDVKYNQRFVFCYVYERNTKIRVKVHRMLMSQVELGIFLHGDIFFKVVDVYAKTNPNSTDLEISKKIARPIDLDGVFGELMLGLLFIYLFAILVFSIEYIYHGYF